MSGPPSEPEDSDYNAIFERLVDGPEDLAGMVAYGRYKWAKREWLIEHQERRGRPPSADELRHYREHWTDSQLGALIDTAEGALTAFTSAVLDAERPKIEAAALKQARSFWTDVGAGVISAFVYTLILIGLALTLRVSGVDLLDAVEGVRSETPRIERPTPSEPDLEPQSE